MAPQTKEAVKDIFGMKFNMDLAKIISIIVCTYTITTKVDSALHTLQDLAQQATAHQQIINQHTEKISVVQQDIRELQLWRATQSYKVTTK